MKRMSVILRKKRIRVRGSGSWLSAARISDVFWEEARMVELGDLVCSLGAVKKNWDLEEKCVIL